MTGSRELVWATSWGVSTRLIGAMVMSHSDDKGIYLHTCFQMCMYRCMYECMFVCMCLHTYESMYCTRCTYFHIFTVLVFLKILTRSTSFRSSFLLSLQLMDSMNRSSSSPSGSPRSSGHCPDH